MSGIRDRVVDLRRVPASELRANPRNWRRHPQGQLAALRGMLAEVGFADVVLARETGDGLEIIDGHARQELMGDAPVPVVVLDLTDDEADKVLATLDPLSAMASTDADALSELIAGLSFQSEAVREMLEELTGTKPSAGESAGDPEDLSGEITSSYQVVVECIGETQQRDLYEELQERGLTCRLLTL